LELRERENSFDAEKRLAQIQRSTNEIQRLSENSFDAEKRLALLWGANSATVAIGAKAVYGGSFQAGLVPPGIVANQLAMIRDGAKAGTLDVAANADLFKFIHDTAIELGAVCNSNTDNPPEVEPAPAISDSTALLHKRNRARLNELRLYRSNL
jgi:hypothetical protein